MSETGISGRRLLTSAQTEDRYQRSGMSLMRWANDSSLAFPKPIKIRGRKYWDADELDAFDARMAGARPDSEAA